MATGDWCSCRIPLRSFGASPRESSIWRGESSLSSLRPLAVRAELLAQHLLDAACRNEGSSSENQQTWSGKNQHGHAYCHGACAHCGLSQAEDSSADSACVVSASFHNHSHHLLFRIRLTLFLGLPAAIILSRIGRTLQCRSVSLRRRKLLMTLASTFGGCGFDQRWISAGLRFSGGIARR